MLMFRGAIVMSVLALLAGCSSTQSGPPPSAVEATTSASVEAPSPTPSIDVASLEEWASLIAVEQARIAGVAADWEELICSSLAIDGGAVDCETVMITMGFAADTTAIIVKGAQDPASPKYLGQVPDAIVPLVEDTLAAAQATASAAASADASCPGEECVGEAFAFGMAMGDLQDSLVAWTPYL